MPQTRPSGLLTLEKLLLKKGPLLSQPLNLGPNLDDTLTARDHAPFDTDWQKARNAILAAFRKQQPEESEWDATEKVRERAFMKTYDLPQGSDIAPEVSDDFGLIGLALLTGKSTSWVAALFQAYASNIFPAGRLRPVRQPLLSLVEELHRAK